MAKYGGGYTIVAGLNVAFGGLTQGLSRALPEHQFTWHRSHGHPGRRDLTIRMGTRAQVMVIGSAVLIAGWLGLATTAMVSGDTDATLAAKQAELATMHTTIQAMKSETAALKGDVAARAEALETRQAFLAALLSDKRDMAQLAKMLPRKVSADRGTLLTVEDLVGPTMGKRGGKLAGRNFQVPHVDMALVEPFAKLETQQLAFVDKAAGAAEAKLRDTQALIRRLGLDPSRFVRASDWNGSAQGMGGPYIPVSTDAEPRFKDLFLSWTKLNNLQTAVAAIPAYMPVKDYRYTSSYGVRYDPFNGGSAMHAGVDMAGSQGEPIYASASGVVLQAGRSNGYGNLVELSHGMGIDTRYGHLSKILVQPGQRIRQGQMIGLMGSTGRSTGTHLHFEVRVDGRSVNPRPFLDASAYVLAAQGDVKRGAPQDFGPMLEDDVVTASVGGMTPIRGLR